MIFLLDLPDFLLGKATFVRSAELLWAQAIDAFVRSCEFLAGKIYCSFS